MSDMLWGVRQVTCNECGVSGHIRIGKPRGRRKDKRTVVDNVEHLETCSLFQRQQPLHLKRKGWVPQEKRANALVGARETLASGAVGKDGDGRKFNEWRVESKRTGTDSFRLTQNTWTKLVSGGLKVGEEPILHLEFWGTHRAYARYVIVRKDFFDGVSDRAVVAEESRRNRVSYRLTRDMPIPLLVELDPPGVVVTEAEFKMLKEQMDESVQTGPPERGPTP